MKYGKSKSIFIAHHVAEVQNGQGNAIVAEQFYGRANSYNSKNKSKLFEVKTNKAIPLDEIVENNTQRLETKDKEFNRVVGGGLVHGSVTLLAGEPGIGKSTLTLKLALSLNQKVLYVTGEESNEQIKLRAKRLSAENKNCFILNETKLENIVLETEKIKPDLIIVDSIQTLNLEDVDAVQGSTTQIRLCAEVLIKYAKTKYSNINIGHVTKEGAIAGPKVLEHMVDTVLQFEGDKNILQNYRSTKNRFGSTNSIGIYEMFEDGLKSLSPNKCVPKTHQLNWYCNRL